jgi:hypothetical protein
VHRVDSQQFLPLLIRANESWSIGAYAKLLAVGLEKKSKVHAEVHAGELWQTKGTKRKAIRNGKRRR